MSPSQYGYALALPFSQLSCSLSDRCGLPEAVPHVANARAREALGTGGEIEDFD